MEKNKINIIIRTLVLSDLLIFFALGLLSPIYAIFVINNIKGGALGVIGFAVTMYWAARVITTIPFSRLMDKIKGERDEYYCMIAGSFTISILPLFYIFSSLPWHIYAIQFLNGIANSLAIPAWRIIFTTHLDRGKTGYEWSLEDLSVGIATAASASIGALIAAKFGFHALFVFISLLSLAGTSILAILYRDRTIFAKEEQPRQGQIRAPLKVDSIK